MSGATTFRNCGSVLVTGANRGLGLQIVDCLANGGFSPGKIIATTRNLESAPVRMSNLNISIPKSYCLCCLALLLMFLETDTTCSTVYKAEFTDSGFEWEVMSPVQH